MSDWASQCDTCLCTKAHLSVFQPLNLTRKACIVTFCPGSLKALLQGLEITWIRACVFYLVPDWTSHCLPAELLVENTNDLWRVEQNCVEAVIPPATEPGSTIKATSSGCVHTTTCVAVFVSQHSSYDTLTQQTSHRSPSPHCESLPSPQ